MPLLNEYLPIASRVVLKSAADKIKYLNVYAYFTQLVVDSIEALCRGDLKLFDAHVGDSACQIRAHQLIRLYQAESIQSRSETFLQDLNILLDQTREAVLNQLKTAHTHSKRVIFGEDFLQAHALTYELSDELSLIFQCFVLRKYTRFGSDTDLNGLQNRKSLSSIDYEKLYEEMFFLGKMPLRSVVKKYQKNIASASCSYIKALLLNNKDYVNMHVVAEKSQKMDASMRAGLPAFLSGEIIFRDLLVARDTRLLLKCQISRNRIIELAYTGNSEDFEYVPVRSLGVPARFIVIYGDAIELDSEEEVRLSIEACGGLYLLLMATFALHRQYSGEHASIDLRVFRNGFIKKIPHESLKDCLSFEKLYARLKQIGENNISNRLEKVFFARHIYADIRHTVRESHDSIHRELIGRLA